MPSLRELYSGALGRFVPNFDLDPEEQQQLEAAASEPDSKVQVEQLRSETDRMIAQLKDGTERIKAMLDAQLKGMSLEQAADAVETQAAGNLALEGMKQEGKKDEQVTAAVLDPENPMKKQEEVEVEPDLATSFQVLGLNDEPV